MSTPINTHRSSEKFEVNGAYLKIRAQLQQAVEGKTLDETIQYLVSRVKGKYLFTKRLKTVCVSIGMMNAAIDRGESEKIVKISEALQLKGFELIADAIARREGVKAILIAGPSSSGKTTFSKKLCMALEQKGMSAKCLSFDDYYVDRELTPRDETGDYDYEHINAINVPLFQQHFAQLLKGGSGTSTLRLPYGKERAEWQPHPTCRPHHSHHGRYSCPQSSSHGWHPRRKHLPHLHFRTDSCKER